MYIIYFMFLLQEIFLLAKVNDCRTISPGSKGVSKALSKKVNAMTFRIALKAVGKSSESMRLRIYKFTTTQNIKMHYDSYGVLYRP